MAESEQVRNEEMWREADELDPTGCEYRRTGEFRKPRKGEHFLSEHGEAVWVGRGEVRRAPYDAAHPRVIVELLASEGAVQ